MPKPTKATKITDKNKPWNKKSQPSAYREEFTTVKETILIVCEGQTEKLYFESFPVLTLKVKAIDLGGQSKLKLIESTEEIVRKSEYENEEYDSIWCVFDMDVKKGEKEFCDFDNSIKRAEQLGYKVAYSNDSFELWFYLHYHYTDLQNHRNFYYQKLSEKFQIKYIPDGKKYNYCLKIYELLLSDEGSSQEQAIERAKKLFNKQKHLPFHQQNPVTKVYELVEELNKNLRR